MNTLDPKAARIVLLDDDEFMLRLLFRMLAQLGYSQLFACESGEQALQISSPPRRRLTSSSWTSTCRVWTALSSFAVLRTPAIAAA